MSYVYCISHNDQYFKIGVSENPERRMYEMQTGNLIKLYCLWKFKCDEPYKLESYVHSLLSKNSISGEWFEITISMCYKILEHLYVLDIEKSYIKSKDKDKENKSEFLLDEEVIFILKNENKIDRETLCSMFKITKMHLCKIYTNRLYKHIQFID